jgi:lysozyme family protein
MSKETFLKALTFVLKWEGGYVNNPNDLGGATNKGITQNTYNAWLKATNQPLKNVKNITDREVQEIYYKNYWLKAGCDKMTEKFAILCFDTAVNMGVGRVSEFLKYAEYKSPDKFIIARIRKYCEFAKVGNQKIFLQGWLNRILDLEKFIQ